jgi:hypothetical protein
MKKLMPFFAAALFGLFALAVFVIVISLSYRALGVVFPDDLFDQAIGLVLFDVAAITWFMQFVYKSESTMQYVYAGFGFLIGLLGMIALVGIEVGISSKMLVAAEMTKPLVYIFIGVAVGHVVLIYLRHSAAPEVNAKISLGIEKAKIQDEGMRQAEQHFDIARGNLGAAISDRLVSEILRDLKLQPQIIDSKLLPVMEVSKAETNFNLPGWLSWVRGGRRFGSSVQAVEIASKAQTEERLPAREDAAPEGIEQEKKNL